MAAIMSKVQMVVILATGAKVLSQSMPYSCLFSCVTRRALYLYPGCHQISPLRSTHLFTSDYWSSSYGLNWPNGPGSLFTFISHWI